LKSFIFIILIYFLPRAVFCLEWDSITISDTLLDFGEVQSAQRHSRQLTIFNHLDQPVKIHNVSFGKETFTCDLDTAEITANGIKTFSVYFEARHNLEYSDLLAVEVSNSIHPLIVLLKAQAVYEDPYYNSTFNKSGTELKSSLHNIVKGHTQYPYTSSSPDVWDILKNTDEDPDNSSNVRLFYTGWSYKKSDQNTGDNNGWNREHVWAKSHGGFGNDPPAGTDVHHIRPADVTVNGARGSLDFDNGGSLYTDDDGATECRYDGDSWEPRDSEKGDTARMLYYMAVRYEGNGEPDLELSESIPSSGPYFGKKSTLYSWHLQDTADAWEKRRNERIFSWQNNRNPFIDHPEFAERMPSISGILIPEGGPEIKAAPESIDLGTTAPGDSVSYFFAVLNCGTADLAVSDISFTDNNFSADRVSLELGTDEYEFIKLTYAADSGEGNFSAAMNISSNDEDTPLLQIPAAVNVSASTGLGTESALPQRFMLYPNYPNPFNPHTKIKFHIPQKNTVQAALYDVLGRRIMIMLDSELAAGVHTISFTPHDLNSGIYYCRLCCGKEVRVQKMMYLK